MLVKIKYVLNKRAIWMNKEMRIFLRNSKRKSKFKKNLKSNKHVSRALKITEMIDKSKWEKRKSVSNKKISFNLKETNIWSKNRWKESKKEWNWLSLNKHCSLMMYLKVQKSLQFRSLQIHKPWRKRSGKRKCRNRSPSKRSRRGWSRKW